MRMLILFYMIQAVAPIFAPSVEILGSVAPDKPLTRIFLCITLEWEMDKKVKKKVK